MSILELETNWMKVIEERLKRNCESALTRYSVRVSERAPKVEKQNGLLDFCIVRSEHTKLTPNNCHPNTKLNSIVPLFKQEDCYNNYIKNFDYNCVPLTMVLLETPNKKLPTVKEETCKEQRRKESSEREPSKWFGIEEIIESYRVYSKGNFY